ncbi:MAG: hypothetical protein ACRDYU_06195 [Actinomycetes bacterium]
MAGAVETGAEPWQRLADRLREAHHRVAHSDADAAERRELTRRLLVITDAAKHDVDAAARRLERFLDELGDPTDGPGEPEPH